MAVIFQPLNMNIARFRVALSHSEPSVVSQGLNDFTRIILQEHDQIDNFGYYSRCYCDENNIQMILQPSFPIETVGLLLIYLKSSPQLEELFLLWNNPLRDKDKGLCSCHMSCLATILHCSKSNPSFCSSIINRILHDHIKSIYSQLSSGHVALIHSTLGLLVIMARSTPQIARDLFQKLNFQSECMLNLVQRGKRVVWSSPNAVSASEEVPIMKLSTDARYLLILLILQVIQYGDDGVLNVLFSKGSILRKLISSIQKDSVSGVTLFLSGIKFIQRNDYFLTNSFQSQANFQLIDEYFQNKVLSLLNSNEVDVQSVAFDFITDYVKCLCKSITSKKSSNSSARFMISKLLKNLHGYKDMKQRQVRSLFMFQLFSFVNFLSDIVKSLI